MNGGYRGKTLEVDLSRGKIVDSELSAENVLRPYLGGSGLGLWLYLSGYNVLCPKW